MAESDVDDKFKELSERINKLPVEPPIAPSPNKAILVTSTVQLVFVVIALIGVVGLVLRVENYRQAQCGFVNQTRQDIVKVLQRSAESPNTPPEQRERLRSQIRLFDPINCENPTKPVSPSTTSSQP